MPYALVRRIGENFSTNLIAEKHDCLKGVYSAPSFVPKHLRLFPLILNCGVVFTILPIISLSVPQLVTEDS